MATNLYKTAPQFFLYEAVKSHRDGKDDIAFELAQKASGKGSTTEVEGLAMCGELLFMSQRTEELSKMLEQKSRFQSDPRWLLLQARNHRLKSDLDGSKTYLLQLLDLKIAPYLYRMASFELIKVYELQKQYSEAWTVATKIHQATTKEYPLNLLVEALKVTAFASPFELSRIRKATSEVPNTAFIHGLPRSGTSILEQILDCHSAVCGIGEANLSGKMGDAIAAEGGGWPIGVLNVSEKTLNSLQQKYCSETRGKYKIPDDKITIDKTVFPNLQPLVLATVLPGSKIIRITRDPRDNAISLFLSNLDPSQGFTKSLDTIYRFIGAEQKYIPIIYKALGIQTHTIGYEDLVANSRQVINGCLLFLGLTWEDNCLHPEKNNRVVQTLSNEQVRKPINSEGIGRWKNYGDHFGPFWNNLMQ